MRPRATPGLSKRQRGLDDGARQTAATTARPLGCGSRRRRAHRRGAARHGTSGCRHPGPGSERRRGAPRRAGRTAVGLAGGRAGRGRMGLPRALRRRRSPCWPPCSRAPRTNCSPRPPDGTRCAPSAARSRRRMPGLSSRRSAWAAGCIEAPFCPACGAHTDRAQRGLVAALPVLRARALPAHRPRRDRRDHQRAAPRSAASRARTRLWAGEPLLVLRGVRRGGRVARGRRGTRSARRGRGSAWSTCATAGRRPGRTRARSCSDSSPQRPTMPRPSGRRGDPRGALVQRARDRRGARR